MKDVVNAARGSINSQNMCRLYDGGMWAVTKGNKRQIIEHARVTMLLFTTPARFQSEVWKKVVKNQDGLDDRFLITFVKKEWNLTTPQRMEAGEELQNSPIRSLNDVYNKIFIEHKTPRVYKLSEEARQRLIAYESDKNNGDWGSKVTKNALKLALNMHILYFRIMQVCKDFSFSRMLL